MTDHILSHENGVIGSFFVADEDILSDHGSCGFAHGRVVHLVLLQCLNDDRLFGWWIDAHWTLVDSYFEKLIVIVFLLL